MRVLILFYLCLPMNVLGQHSYNDYNPKLKLMHDLVDVLPNSRSSLNTECIFIDLPSERKFSNYEIEFNWSFGECQSWAFQFSSLEWYFKNSSAGFLHGVRENATKFRRVVTDRGNFTMAPGKTMKCTIRKVGELLFYFVDESLFASSRVPNDFCPVINFSADSTSNFELNYKVTFLPDNALSEQNRLLLKNNRNILESTYRAIIIGVSDYDSQGLYLPRPVADAKRLKTTLLRYGFSDSTIYFLENPTRRQIITTLYRLREELKADDNLLIFYAGHGSWDEDAKQGYWWPRDADPADPSTWLSNSNVSEQILAMNRAAHILLISDACFSGSILRARSGAIPRDIEVLYSLKSRRAMTSGTLTVVDDNSIFFDYFEKALRENQEKYLSSQRLFDFIRIPVINNSRPIKGKLALPQDGTLIGSGDEGGDFIFVLKG